MVGVQELAAGGISLDGQPVAESSTFIEQFTPILHVDADGRFAPPRPGPDPIVERRWPDLHREPTSR